MENENVDILKIKIEKAKEAMPKEAIEAIDSVNWRMILLEMKKEYSDEQIDVLETELELLFSKLISAKEFPKELEKRMQLPFDKIQILINNLNNLIFKKIQENLIKLLENNNASTSANENFSNENKLREFEASFGKKGLLGMALYAKNKNSQTPLRALPINKAAEAKKHLDILIMEQKAFAKKYSSPETEKDKIDLEIKDIQSKLLDIRSTLKTITKEEEKEEIKRKEVLLSADLFKHFTIQKELEYVLSLPEKIAKKQKEIAE